MLTYLVLLTFVAILLLIAGGVWLFFRREDQVRERYEEARAAGLNLPVSLHPRIDPEVCIGSGACVDACPEKVLGIVDGKTRLVEATSCIGHGRCHDVCPVNSIALVFGTAERGVDIPLLRAGYQTNVDGLYVVGELGGMGLIRNAMRQGTQVIDSIRENLAEPFRPEPDVVDVLIVGAGPAGLAAALRCVELNMSYRLLEQYQLGGSVTHYPRRKMIFTEILKLPVVGRFGKAEMLKEELIAEFERVVSEAGIELIEHRRVTAVQGRLGAFQVKAAGPEGDELHRARTIVLAIGRRGTPRKLGVPGEDSPHVVYRLLEPEQYRHKKVLVVGGGDSAVESAIALGDVAGAEVHLSYRGQSFYRIKPRNRQSLEAAIEAGRVTPHLETNVKEIAQGTVVLVGAEGELTLDIDDVVVQVGGMLPTPFLESMGIQVETKHGEEVDVQAPSRRLAKTVARATGRLTRASGRLNRSWSDDGSSRRFERATKAISGRLAKSEPLELDSGSVDETAPSDEPGPTRRSTRRIPSKDGAPGAPKASRRLPGSRRTRRPGGDAPEA